MITVLSPSPALDVSYLLDEVEVGGIHRPRQVLRLPGGKGLNLARAAAVLGAGVRVVAPLGGPLGALIEDLAMAEGLDLDAVRIAADARECVSAIPDAGAPTEFYEPAPELSAAESRELAARFAEAPQGGWSALAGSMPATTDLAAALHSRRQRGDRLAVDSSGGGLAALVDGIRPDLLKINRSEAAELAGPGDLQALASSLHARTGGTIVLTDGAAGALAVDATGTWRAAPDPQPGRFAIGSGDSFFAGLLVALAGGASLPDALHTASAAGSANTRAPGAGVFTPADVASTSSRIEVHPL